MLDLSSENYVCKHALKKNHQLWVLFFAVQNLTEYIW